MTTYFVYIVASLARVLYVGVTSDLPRRIVEHRTGAIAGFTQRYRVNRLVYYEAGENIRSVIEREKQLKGWTRRRKAELIEAQNPGWEDLAVHIGLPVAEDGQAR
ncbi:GIY-YIG nuclease family protein [Longimicrobium terrae]|uniref:Putative endonuclease n=1 Tax=Longimicrobium terrae TaxID=1639882 RepID=A0A841H3U7_9BACT|nr:GIY-YIG nuclease family protein [Longimicrobium terrae]MBB4638440.1 putative endonuclease [Longimicrobium terrae]MBB6072717.1 putative endonuclease [Longimicrobium terrae]NNC32409.1 GIY-YIG nuclease family protein [Longimicrobium terrae]